VKPRVDRNPADSCCATLAVMTAPQTELAAELRIPERLPLLEALSWFDKDWRALSPIDMLRRYESGWRQRGVMADPSDEELAFVRELIRRHGSFLHV